MSQYTIIYKINMVSIHIGLKLKGSKKIFSQETMAAGKKHFAPELNEKEVTELLEHATPGSTKRAIKCGMKIFQGKNLELYFDNLHIQKLSVHCNIRFLLTK